MSPLLLVARREVVSKLRSKAFRLSTALLLALVLAAAVLPALLGGDGDDPLRLGVVGDQAAALADAAEQQAPALGESVEPVALDDEDAASAAVTTGDVDAALVGDGRVLVDEELALSLERVLSSAARASAVSGALEDAGVPADEQAALLAPPELEVDRLSAEPEVELDAGVGVGVIGGFALYGLLIFYGQQVAQGVVEEKQTRVVEVLLSTISPRTLLGGKVLGLGLVGLAQIVLLALVGGGAALAAGTVDVPAEAFGVLGLVLLWFVLGYALYAALFAVSGAVVTRTEDLQSSATPVVFLLIGSLLLVQLTFTDLRGPLATFAGVLPFSAPLAQPLRLAAGVAEPWEVALALVLTVGLTLLLVPVAARAYTRTALKTRGRTSLLAALRGRA